MSVCNLSSPLLPGGSDQRVCPQLAQASQHGVAVGSARRAIMTRGAGAGRPSPWPVARGVDATTRNVSACARVRRPPRAWPRARAHQLNHSRFTTPNRRILSV